MSDDTVTLFGVEIEPDKTKVYRDSNGNLRVQHTVIIEPETNDEQELSEGEDVVGTVESVNEDGTVTVSLGDG